MRATVMYGAGDVRVENVPDAGLRELTGGLGAHSVLERVGHGEAMLTALSIARPGGAVGRVGVPQGESIAASLPTFGCN